jgi:antitoxin component YwqK of YwqJK toxin-antitoxin module
MRDGAYVDGEKDGPWLSYYANGSKMSQGSYSAGRKVGRWVQYWSNGAKKSEGTFADGKYTGLYTCWYENGCKQWEGYYNPIKGNSADGTKEGVWLAYDRDTGEVSRLITYRRGSRARPDQLPPYDELPRMGPDPADP